MRTHDVSETSTRYALTKTTPTRATPGATSVNSRARWGMGDGVSDSTLGLSSFVRSDGKPVPKPMWSTKNSSRASGAFGTSPRGGGQHRPSGRDLAHDGGGHLLHEDGGRGERLRLAREAQRPPLPGSQDRPVAITWRLRTRRSTSTSAAQLVIVVDLERRRIELHEAGSRNLFAPGEHARSRMFPDLAIDVSELFVDLF